MTGFGALPAGVVAAAPGAPTAPWWLVTAGGALGAAAHFANVAPDLEDDLATGVRGPAAPARRRVSRRSSARSCSAAPRWCSSSDRTVRRRPPAGSASRSPSPRSSSPPWPGTARFRRLAFPAVLLLTVLDVVLLLLGGAAVT